MRSSARGELVTNRLVALLGMMLLCAGLMPAQPTTVPLASKDDWEEINFEFNSAVLTDGFPSLLRLGELLSKNPDFRVKLSGHADALGGEAYNEQLSNKRSEAVKAFLLKYGALPGQIQLEFHGKKQPKVTGASPESRFINRR